jgi:hypothetical protein
MCNKYAKRIFPGAQDKTGYVEYNEIYDEIRKAVGAGNYLELSKIVFY